MPRYRITEYRDVNRSGLACSGTSVIAAKDIHDARLSAQCINQPKGEWRVVKGVHYKGFMSDGNMSVVQPLN